MNSIREKMILMSDNYLLDIVHNHRKEYEIEAIEIITEILCARGLSIEQIQAWEYSTTSSLEEKEPESIPILFEMQESMGGYQSIYDIRDRKTIERNEKTARPWIRFWARSIDVILWGQTFGRLLAYVNKNFELHLDSLLWGCLYSVLITVPWIFAESAMLSIFGYTFGKWLLRVKITSSKGNSISYGTAIKRTFLVALLGSGLGVKLISEILNIVSYFMLKNHQISKWDEIASTKVEHGIIGWKRTIVAALVILCPLFLVMNDAYHILF